MLAWMLAGILNWMLAGKLAGMLGDDAKPGCWLRYWALPSPTCRGQSGHAVMGPAVEALQGSASESQLCEYHSSSLLLPSPPFLSLSLFLSHTHTHTHVHTHACMCIPEPMSSFYPWLAGWVGSFLLELFVRLSFK